MPEKLSQKNFLILVVDDSQKNIQLLGTLLENHKYSITAALNGYHAIEQANKLIPDLILLDVMMPGIDGFAVCNKLKESPSTSEIPIIFITAKTDSEDIVKGFNCGCADYVTKPFKQDELISRVGTHLKLNKQKQMLIKLNSDLKKSEEKYKGLFNSGKDAILLLDMDYNIKDLNYASCKMTGYDAFELKHINCKKLFPESWIDSINNELINEITQKEYSKEYEKFIITKDEKLLPVEVIFWKNKSKLNDKKEIWVLIRDISEKKEYERMKNDVEQIIRHDMRSAIHAIINCSSLIEKEFFNLNTAQINCTKIINERGHYLNNLINQSRKLLQIEQGKYKLKPEINDIIHIFEKIKNQFKSNISDKNLKLCFINKKRSISWNDNYTVLGDSILLENMFSNLIKNAIEASPNNQTVTIEIIENEKESEIFSEDDYHEITIHNFGVIPVEVRKHFFKKYSTFGKYHGTGLGTYISNMIAKIHGGNIKFQTSEEHGTTLQVFLSKFI